jgi:phosphatidylserine/phosphatidylglycerophosphate/cardiolipin synthase-like enzyme
VAVIDERKLFVGSMNLDERSERLNTELGMLIDSPDLARQFLQMSALTESAYHLRLSADGRDIEWVSGSGPDAEVVKAEPETSWWLRFQVWLLSDVIPASEL